MATKFFYNALNYELDTELCGTVIITLTQCPYTVLVEYLEKELEWKHEDYVIRALNAIQVIGMESVH